MYNLKEGGGTFKGLIGECLFKQTNEKVIVTKFFNKNNYFTIFGHLFNEQQKSFLSNNWYSIDAIDVFPELILYEVKTRNRYRIPLHFKPKMTLKTHNLYQQTKELGFKVLMVTVWLNENWDYDLEFLDFNESNYCIDQPKKYD